MSDEPFTEEYIREVSAALLKVRSSVVFKTLTKWGTFEKYEMIVGIAAPHSQFRQRLAVEIARYIDGAWIEATPPDGDLAQIAKASRHRLRITENRLTRSKRPLIGDAMFHRAFAERTYDQHRLNAHKRPRGRATKEFAAIFVERAAKIFTEVTGAPATIVNNRDGDNGGVFGRLLEEITRDTLDLASGLKLDRSRLSANLARLARQKRKKPEMAPR
jgi:hypothetical protein